MRHTIGFQLSIQRYKTCIEFVILLDLLRIPSTQLKSWAHELMLKSKKDDCTFQMSVKIVFRKDAITKRCIQKTKRNNSNVCSLRVISFFFLFQTVLVSYLRKNGMTILNGSFMLDLHTMELNKRLQMMNTVNKMPEYVGSKKINQPRKCVKRE